MQVYRAVVYQDASMNLALLVAHTYAADAYEARQMVRSALSEFGVKMHIGELAEVTDFPREHFANKPIKLTRYSAGF